MHIGIALLDAYIQLIHKSFSERFSHILESIVDMLIDYSFVFQTSRRKRATFGSNKNQMSGDLIVHNDVHCQRDSVGKRCEFIHAKLNM